MKQSTSVYVIIFLIIAVIAFILSNVFASVLVIDTSNSTKLTAIEDDGFQPVEIKQVKVIIPKVENNTTTYIENVTGSIKQVVETVM
ncbi:MAG: hypothetical protein K6A34_09160 [Methanobrevibacter sp.]|nr:hypothetical protein [Methanobrevibacter sp.]